MNRILDSVECRHDSCVYSCMYHFLIGPLAHEHLHQISTKSRHAITWFHQWGVLLPLNERIPTSTPPRTKI